VTATKTATTKRAVVVAAVVGSAILFVCWLVWWTRPPQMGADEEVFQTVDALFTAVTGRDEARLADCEQRLHALKDAGKLPEDAAVYLDRVIRKAQDGRWESAAETLYDFMKVQRREGPRDHPSRKEKGRRP
jgi:hypothetical protein